MNLDHSAAVSLRRQTRPVQVAGPPRGVLRTQTSHWFSGGGEWLRRTTREDQHMQRSATTRFGRLVLCGLASAAALAFFVAPAQAQTTATIDYSVTITAAAPTCSVTVPAVDWGNLENVQGGSGSAVVVYDISFDCTTSVSAASLSFDGGLNGTGGTGDYVRQVANGADQIAYSILHTGSQAGLQVDEVITFALPAGSSIRQFGSELVGYDGKPVGTYTDQVVATFTF